MGLCFATNNKHKIAEVQALLPPELSLLSLQDIQCTGEIPETADTIAGNAVQKASYVWERFSVDCFADDTGLEVSALDGAPGVHSARYAGAQRDNQANCSKLLKELAHSQDRSAQFRTVICLILAGQQHLFEGVIEGQILEFPRGANGFGYDPLFQPQGYRLTFAEMSAAEKNQCSHRSIAINKLVAFLKEG